MIWKVAKLIIQIAGNIILFIVGLMMLFAAFRGCELNIGDYPNPPYFHWSNEGYNNSIKP